ncbi:MAG: mandelate racemase/muconate lactonizing enzyme family protein [Spirochaetaceae bacterium]|nr:MAG: mandelate racemase/muconate lactonizing enzyme family protein [Spirochaetaceae bacterium]
MDIPKKSGVFSAENGTAPIVPLETIGDTTSIIPAPVVIAAVRVYRYDGAQVVEFESTDGVIGRSMANDKLADVMDLAVGRVFPYFVGRDARHVGQCIDEIVVYEKNYKFLGLPFWNAVGNAELALWDLLGRTAGKPVYELVGKKIRDAMGIYVSSLERDTTPEEEIGWVAERVVALGAKAVKLKIGGRMSRNADASPGRSEKLLALGRKEFGPDVEFYVDANGSYDARTAIEVGRMLAEHNVAFFEEPCPFLDFVSTKRVADVLTIPVAGGEQDTNEYLFKWYLDNHGLDIVQPDLYYNGGLVRTVAIARMAESAGVEVRPHSPKADPLAAPLLQFAAFTPNLGEYNEFRGRPMKHKPWYSPQFVVENGEIAIPTGAGLGVEYDDVIRTRGELVAEVRAER